MTIGALAVRQARHGAVTLRRTAVAWQPHAARLALPAYLVIVGVFVSFRLLEIGPWLAPGFDLHAYWSTRDGLDYTLARPGAPGAYLYSPVFAQAIAPLTMFSWPAFAAVWTAIVAGLLAWLAGRWAIALLLVLPVLMSIAIGQVDLFIAAAIVVGFRWPAAWALPILTKVTPGLCLLWFAARREWRSLAIALAATGILVTISYALDGDAWWGWLGMLTRGQFPSTADGQFLAVPLGWRLALAAVLIVWGARTDRRWVVPISACLALPTVWINSPTILVACLPLIAAGASTPAGRWLGSAEPR